MKIVRAETAGGQVLRAANGGYHVTGKSGTSAYRQMLQFGEGVAGNRMGRPYEKSVWVMRAIKCVSQPVAALPLELYGDKRRGSQLLSGGPAVDFWEDPFVGISRVDGIEATIAWLNLSGNAFWLRDDSWFDGSAAKSRLIIARPDRMQPVKAGSELVGWRYRDADGSTRLLPLPYVEHLKFWNPYDDVWGLGQWEAARIATEADYYAGSYLRNLMASSGDQGDIVTNKGLPPSKEQQEQITMALRQRRQFRQRGEFIPVFLTGDVSVQDPAVQSPDAAFVSNRLENRHEIFLAFGVPPSMADIKASYSTGADSDYARLIEQTCLPISTKICEHVENVSNRLNDGASRRIYACFAWEENSCFQQIRISRIENATKFWDRGMSWKTINEVMDLGLVEFDGWEKAYIPFSVAEVGGEDPGKSPDYADQPADPADPADQLAKLFASRRKHRVPTCGKAASPQEALWRNHMGLRRTTAQIYKAKFTKELAKARAEVISRIDRAGRSEMVAALQGAKIKAVASDFLFDITRWKKGFLGEMRKAGTAALAEAGKQFFEEIAKDDPFTMPPAKALEFLTKRENRLSEVGDDVYNQIREALMAGLDEGDTMDELAGRVRREFNAMSRSRAQTVAMTETAAAYGTARHEAMQQAGIKYKQWLTSGNENVRASHRAAQAQTVEVHEPFTVGAAKLMFPGDPAGPASEVINCHCVQIAVAQPPES